MGPTTENKLFVLYVNTGTEDQPKWEPVGVIEMGEAVPREDTEDE